MTDVEDVAVVLLGSGAAPAEKGSPMVQTPGFVALEDALQDVDAVYCAGGTGIVLATPSRGLPMVVQPFLADQPWNAARLADLDLAVVVDDGRDAGAVLHHALRPPAQRGAAQAAVRATETMPAADDVLIRLLEEAMKSASDFESR